MYELDEVSCPYKYGISSWKMAVIIFWKYATFTWTFVATLRITNFPSVADFCNNHEFLRETFLTKSFWIDIAVGDDTYVTLSNR